jgi:hypothetical protein
MSETVARADEVRDDHRVRPVPWVKVTMNRTSFGKIVPLSIAMQCLGAGAVRHVLLRSSCCADPTKETTS